MNLCVKCRAPLPDGAKFCMNCGTAGVQSGLQTTNSKRTIVVVASSILGLAVLAFGLNAAGVIRIGGKAGGDALKAQGQLGGPVLQVQGKAGGDMTQVINEHKTMPKDIYDWLEHLRKTEFKADQLTARQVSDFSITKILTGTGMSEDTMKQLLWGDPGEAELKPPTEDIAKKAAQAQREWEELRTFFNSYPPPAECVPIRNSYDQGLKETGAMLFEILDAIAKVFENPSEAHRLVSEMKGDSAKRVDSNRKDTDQKVADICNKYDTKKWFDIPADIGGGMLGSMGMPNVSPMPQNMTPP